METGKRDLKLVTVNFSHATVVTKEFISKTSLRACFCHAGLSGIFLQEGFPTSGNDIQVALLMTVLVIVARDYGFYLHQPRDRKN